MLRLSEIKGERALDVLADLVEPVANIASDKEAAELFGKKSLPEGMAVREFVIHRLRVAIPKLLKAHKKDLVKILSLLSEMSEEEYLEQLTVDGVIVDLSTMMTDALFNAFFTTPQSTEISSGSASENTAE